MATTSSTGMVLTASDAASQLYSQDRDSTGRLTWANLYNSNTLAGATAQQSLNNSYTDATTQAYISYLNNKSALQNSNVVGSARASSLAAYDSSYQSTLADYQSTLSENRSAINESVSENEENITAALTERAQNYADYTSAHYDYLSKLYDEYLEGNNDLFDRDNWSKYLYTEALLDEEGNEQYNEDGNLVLDDSATRLKTWQELSDVSVDDNGEYTSLLDENGNLTSLGIDYFDQLENDQANADGGYSWNDYLLDTNEDLYNWANSYDYYNYTQAGTNAGTVRTKYGMMSTDMTYSYLERFGGMTSTQINDTFSSFTSEMENLINSENLDDISVDDFQSAYDTLKAGLQELNIYDGLLEKMGISSTELDDQITEYIYNIDTLKGSYDTKITQNVIGGALIGTGATVALVGGANPVTIAIGGFLAGVGVLIKTLSNIGGSVESTKTSMDSYKSDLQSQYMQLLASLTDYINSNPGNNTSNIY